MADAGDLIDIKFLDGDPPEREKWERVIRKAFGSGFGKARLKRSGERWEVTQVLIHEPSKAQEAGTLPAPRDGRVDVATALRAAGLPVTD